MGQFGIHASTWKVLVTSNDISTRYKSDVLLVATDEKDIGSLMKQISAINKSSDGQYRKLKSCGQQELYDIHNHNELKHILKML